MSQPANQSEAVKYKNDYSEGEIELIDIIRIIWNWKYLIIGGTLICALATLVISSILPKTYRIKTLIQPGILSFNEKGNIYLDTPDNIKALIEAGTFDSRSIRIVQIRQDLLRQYWPWAIRIHSGTTAGYRR